MPATPDSSLIYLPPSLPSAPYLPARLAHPLQAVFDELCSILDGGDPKKTELRKGKTNVVMFVGLQGE